MQRHDRERRDICFDEDERNPERNTDSKQSQDQGMRPRKLLARLQTKSQQRTPHRDNERRRSEKVNPPQFVIRRSLLDIAGQLY